MRAAPANIQKWPLTPLQIRAMTLELAAASAQRCDPDLLFLMALAMNVPETFLRDPSELLSGRDGKGKGVGSSVRDGAAFLDWLSVQRTGKAMSVNALAKAVGAARSADRDWAKGWGWRK